MLREIKSKEIYNIIVDTDREHIQLFFRNLLQLQMNNDKVIVSFVVCSDFIFCSLGSIITPSHLSMLRH